MWSEFDSERLAESIAATFERRRTEVPEEAPIGPTSAVADDTEKAAQWRVFVQRTGATDAPEVADCLAVLHAFLLPPMQRVRTCSDPPESSFYPLDDMTCTGGAKRKSTQAAACSVVQVSCAAMKTKHLVILLAIVFISRAALAAEADVWDRVQHGSVDSGGVTIHYASLGSGPPVVLIHGFPDFWYTWRHQMSALAAAGFRAVAIDQRGYDLSEAPPGVESYAMPLLVGDVVAVIKSLGVPSATVVGHDWGGVVAWQVALNVPEVVDRLIILNLPHPNGLARELAANPQQLANSEYARVFQAKTSKDPDVFFGGPMTAESISSWVRDPAARARYVEAFSHSDLDAMLNYYKANYPRPPYEARWAELQRNPGPKLRMPVLMFHGLNDTALNAKGLNDTWEWLDKDLTLVTVPGSDHFVQQDAAELVSETMVWWLEMRTKK